MIPALLDFLFPKRCVSCGTFGVYLCRKCLVKIKFIETPVCPVCERPAIGGATHPGCQTKSTLDGLISVCVYDGPIKAAIKRLKYKPWITDLGKILTDSVVEHLHSHTSINYLIEVKPTVVPVPLHPSRERERGFNQSEILGKLLAQRLNLEIVPNLLIRHKKTKPQADLKGKDRQENIRDAFVLNHNSSFLIHNPNILLVDDVWTTGSTLKACCDVLKRAGTRKVWALTLAR